jgi:hypothetical protein
MKKLLKLLLFMMPLGMMAQSCPGGDFDFKVQFDKRISLENMAVLYSQNHGNMISSISYSIDVTNNEVHIWGSQVICLGAPFATFIFSVITKGDRAETYSNYCVSTCLLSLRGELPQIKFVKEGPRHIFIFYDNTINGYRYLFTMPNIPLPDTMFKINPN